VQRRDPGRHTSPATAQGQDPPQPSPYQEEKDRGLDRKPEAGMVCVPFHRATSQARGAEAPMIPAGMGPRSDPTDGCPRTVLRCVPEPARFARELGEALRPVRGARPTGRRSAARGDPMEGPPWRVGFPHGGSWSVDDPGLLLRALAAHVVLLEHLLKGRAALVHALDYVLEDPLLPLGEG
jgi:hypothetical protein